jgi:uncharacterized protein (TIGR02246 family)
MEIEPAERPSNEAPTVTGKLLKINDLQGSRRRGRKRELTMKTRRIRLIINALVMLAMSATISMPVVAQPDSHDRDQAAIQAVLQAQQAAWNRGDLEAFLDGYWHSPELTFSGASGIVRGWDGVLARYKQSYADRAAMGHLEFSGLEFRFLGADVALVLGHWHLARANGDIGGVFSLVWQRFPEGWHIIHDHTSVVAEAK